MVLLTRDVPEPDVPTPGRRFAVLVGIGKFQEPRLPQLQFTTDDVEELAKLLKQDASLEVTTLLDEHATKAGILNAIRDVHRVIRSEDLLLLYFCTHGVRRGDVSCLIAHDSVPWHDSKAFETCILVSDLVENLPSLKTLLIVTDSCHQSGLWSDGGFSFPQSLSENVAGLQSSRFNEVSTETPELRHGVFTYYLLEGLRGSANRGDQNEVSIFDLARYVTRKVTDYTNGQQNPVLTYRGGDDFVIYHHSPTKEEQQVEELLSRMQASWRADENGWGDVLDRWDELLPLLSDNHHRGLAMALDARRGLDARVPPRYTCEPLEALGGYPRVWPCLLDSEAPLVNAVRTHPEAVIGDLLLGLQFLDSGMLIVSGVWLAQTSSFPALRTGGNARADEASRGKGSRHGQAHYVVSERKLVLEDRLIDLEAEGELREGPSWRDLVLDKRPLGSLTADLRAMTWRDSTDGAPGVWTMLRGRILTRYPGQATQLFELELLPIRRMAAILSQSSSTTGSEVAALREIGSRLIASYLAAASGEERSRWDRYLKHALDDALSVVAGKAKRKTPRRRPRPTVQPAGGRASDPPYTGGAGGMGDPSLAMSVPQHVSSSPAPRSDEPLEVSAVPGARDAAHEVIPAPAPRPLRVRPGASPGLGGAPVLDAAEAAAPSQAAPDLRLRILSGVVTLRDGERELWRRADASFDWGQPRFTMLRDPSRPLTLDQVRGKLASWNREQTEHFGGELAALLFGDPVQRDVINALAVDAGSRRRLVLELDSNAAEAPWEYLRINTGFIAERRLSIVRHVDASGTKHAHPLILEPAPAEIVFAYADPGNKTPVLQDHRERIEKALRPLKLPIHSRSRCTADDLQRALQDTGADGFHFLGHGDRGHDKRPSLRVHSDNGGAERLLAEKLAPWLAGSKARFVFLGACHSGDAAPGFSGIAEAIVRESGIPVIAMQLAVPQEFSTNFAVNFYERLVSGGYDLERAVYEARQFQYAERHAFGIPVLFADVDKEPRPIPELPAPPSGSWATFAVVDVAPSPPLAPPKIEPPLPTIDRAIIEPVDDVELEIDWDVARPTLAKLYSSYALADDLLLRIAGELAAGRHVVLTGPVGTGKTTIASDLVRALGYRPYVVTASAEWTSFEVVGGFFPHALKDGSTHRVDYAWRPGVFLEAVHANWEVRSAPDELSSHWHRRAAAGARGTWLVLDELNRADMDRALGGVFTALESRRLRIPLASVQPGTPVTVEIPIPKDFRILATMNGVDRHYLFRLSDALKRRFAFIEVGVSEQLGDEWKKILARCGPRAADLDAGEQLLHEDLRSFVYLVRAFHPVGTAQLLAALRFVTQSHRTGLSSDARLCQALAGSILPGLEEAPRELLEILRRWSETRRAEDLAAALGKARALCFDETTARHGAAPQLSAQVLGMVTQLEALQRDVESVARSADLDGGSDDRLLRRFAQLVVRRGDPDDLPRLRTQLSAMARS